MVAAASRPLSQTSTIEVKTHIHYGVLHFLLQLRKLYEKRTTAG